MKRDSLYTEIKLETIMSQLKPGEILEIEEVYLGKEKKFVPCILISKLTEKQTQERLAIRAKNEKKKGITYKERTKQLSSINVYITNTPPSYVTKEQVYPLYSLRWQVEILFKTWKSLFHIVLAGKEEGFSIITSTRRQKYINNLFENYSRQTYEKKELIIILNKDKMNIQKYKKKAEKYVNIYIYQLDEKKSLGACLNYGVSKAKYNFVAKFDDDDYYAPSYLKEYMEIFKKSSDRYSSLF